jgi:hypothetical protein
MASTRAQVYVAPSAAVKPDRRGQPFLKRVTVSGTGQPAWGHGFKRNRRFEVRSYRARRLYGSAANP